MVKVLGVSVVFKVGLGWVGSFFLLDLENKFRVFVWVWLVGRGYLGDGLFVFVCFFSVDIERFFRLRV